MKTAALLAAALACCVAQLAHATVYHYRQDGGRRTYTDTKPEHRAYSIIGRYGRPVASASCIGATPAALRQRADGYDEIVQRHASAQNLPAALVHAVMRVESCLDRNAISRVGARGLMQLMPGTAAQLGVRDSFNPDQNINGGTRYLRMMMDRFKGDTRLALAAYNAGPEAVAKHRGIPPFKETKKYVQRVMAAYRENERSHVQRKSKATTG